MSRPRPKSTPPVSNRYTPLTRNIRFRPGWHKALGIASLLVGIAVAAMNDLMLLDFPVTLLPGGHNEAYMLLGVVTGGSSLWWFGWLDRTR